MKREKKKKIEKIDEKLLIWIFKLKFIIKKEMSTMVKANCVTCIFRETGPKEKPFPVIPKEKCFMEKEVEGWRSSTYNTRKLNISLI